ncbi:protein FAM43B [Apteryx mantelli]|uniref:Protein FAM43B n=1 Tax=Apteryx mantelli TaxID=2696672 RepID=A0ABM4FR22_9AVES
MLPWRRSKFVLAEKEGEGKAKSLAPGLGYASLLAGLLRCRPDLFPEAPLERLGSVFRRRRRTVELNGEAPTYTVRYLGNAATLQAKGEGCTDEAVGKIWAKSGGGGGGTKMRLTLGPHGIRLAPCERGARRPAHAYPLHRITHCGADGRHPRLFAWVCRHQAKNKAVALRCHAALAPGAEAAGAMALLLRQAAAAALADFRRLQRQSDGRRGRQQRLGAAAVPAAPLRKLLNAPRAYRAPAAAPRLGAIREEREDDHDDEEEDGGGEEGSFGQGRRAEVLRLAGELRGCSLRGGPAPPLIPLLPSPPQ